MTTTTPASSGLSPLQIFDITLVILFMFIAVFIILIVGYKKRKTPMLRLFGARYFRFGIVNPAGQLTWINKKTSDFKLLGKVILFWYNDVAYSVTEDTLFWINNIPCALYKFNNPIPISILEKEDTFIRVYDEDLKKEINISLSGQELKGAIESKVVNELNKVGFNRIEMVVIIFMLIAILLQIVGVYMAYQAANDYNTLVGQINTILNQYFTHTTTGIP